MTAEDRAMLACKKLNLPQTTSGHAYLNILDQIEEAMRDQRHACEDALRRMGYEIDNDDIDWGQL